jgi:hypothetical protein
MKRRSADPATTAFVASLTWSFKELLDPFGKHLSFHDGEIIPHVFMGDIRRWAEGLVQVNSPLLSRFLQDLSEAYECGISTVRNLIDVSFVEQLPYPDEPHAEIRDLLPPNLRVLLWHGEPEDERPEA